MNKPKWFRLKTSDIIAIILALWSTALTYYLSRQEAKVAGIKTLIDKVSKQLEISQQLQARTLRADSLIRMGNRNRLRASCNSINSLLPSMNDWENQGTALLEISAIIKSQMDNPFLLEDANINELWHKSDSAITSTIIWSKKSYLKQQNLTTDVLMNKVNSNCLSLLKDMVKKTLDYCY